jgi:hypothetical protein
MLYFLVNEDEESNNLKFKFFTRDKIFDMGKVMTIALSNRA